MRRFKQKLNDKECVDILKRNTNIVIGMNGPYIVPLSYVYHNGYIYFHSAISGRKVDIIKSDPRVSFTIIDKDMIVPEKFTTYFRSVIGSGVASIVEDKEEMHDALYALCMKYSYDFENKIEDEIISSLNRVLVIRIQIDELCGKEAIELVKEKENVK